MCLKILGKRIGTAVDTVCPSTKTELVGNGKGVSMARDVTFFMFAESWCSGRLEIVRVRVHVIGQLAHTTFVRVEHDHLLCSAHFKSER